MHKYVLCWGFSEKEIAIQMKQRGGGEDFAHGQCKGNSTDVVTVGRALAPFQVSTVEQREDVAGRWGKDLLLPPVHTVHGKIHGHKWRYGPPRTFHPYGPAQPSRSIEQMWDCPRTPCCSSAGGPPTECVCTLTVAASTCGWPFCHLQCTRIQTCMHIGRRGLAHPWFGYQALFSPSLASFFLPVYI